MTLIPMQQAMLAQVSTAPSYDSVVAAAAPIMWWKHEEQTGSTAADSSGNGRTGTSVVAFSTAGVSIVGVSGYAGLDRGHKTRVITTTDSATLAVGGSSSSSWTLVIWAQTGAAGPQYVLSRVNQAAVLYDYATAAFEFFRIGGTGSDPRTGSQITAPTNGAAPRMIVYRYNNTNWSGWRDGSKIFDVTRSFGLDTSVQKWTTGGNSAGASNSFAGNIFDTQIYDRALSDSEIGAIYAARDST